MSSTANGYAPAASSTATNEEQEEGVLKDVLDELDRERSRRAELEEQVRKLQEQEQQRQQQEAAALAKQKRQTAAQESVEPVSNAAFLAMEAQVEGFQQLVDALTLGKPAIAAAAAEEKEQSRSRTTFSQQKSRSTGLPRKKKTLPLHVVRLLEVLPWDARAQEHIFATEELFEWQIHRENQWQSHIRYFPQQFKMLPVVKPKPKATGDGLLSAHHGDAIPTSAGATTSTGKQDRSLLHFLAGGELAASSKYSKQRGIFSNECVTALYTLDAGMPIPDNDGGIWEWVGGWRVAKHQEKHQSTSEVQVKKVDCDENGWSYCADPQHFLLDHTDLIWDNPGAGDGTHTLSQDNDHVANPKRKFRRRRWTRQRILVDYLYASKSTQEYLRLLAESARLAITAGKISDQLVQTKTALTETEEKLMEARDALRQKEQMVSSLGTAADRAVPTSILEASESSRTVGSSSGDSVNAKLQELFSKNNEQVKDLGSKLFAGKSNEQVKDLGNKFTQWVQSTRKPSEDLTSVESGGDLSLIAEVAANGEAQLQADQQEKFDFHWKKIGRGQLINKIKSGESPFKRLSQGSGHSKSDHDAGSLKDAVAQSQE
jgi:hypothetical protein